MTKRIICSNSASPFRYFAWPSVARLQDGTIAMVCSGFRFKHICPFGKAVISYSRDEGKTWTYPAPVIDTPLDDRDSGIVPFGDHRVMMTSFNNTLDFQTAVNARRDTAHSPRSDAEKALIDAYIAYVRELGTAEQYLGSTYKISDDGGYTFGKMRFSPVTSPHGPLAMPDGSLLYIGRRYTKNDSDDGGDTPYIQCWKLNAEDAFEYVSSIPNCDDGLGHALCVEPHACVLADGKILVHIRVQRYSGGPREFTVWQSESRDGGKTFTAPRQLFGPTGGAPAHLLPLRNGLIVSVVGYREEPYGVRAYVSRDQGETWNLCKVLDDTAATEDLGYPASVECRDGSILTVWYENIGDQSVIMAENWKTE